MPRGLKWWIWGLIEIGRLISCLFFSTYRHYPAFQANLQRKISCPNPLGYRCLGRIFFFGEFSIFMARSLLPTKVILKFAGICVCISRKDGCDSLQMEARVIAEPARRNRLHFFAHKKASFSRLTETGFFYVAIISSE